MYRAPAHARADTPRRDENGRRIPQAVACVCGWTSDTLDGWDGLAAWYGHVGILPPPEPAADAVEQFLRGTS